MTDKQKIQLENFVRELRATAYPPLTEVLDFIKNEWARQFNIEHGR